MAHCIYDIRDVRLNDVIFIVVSFSIFILKEFGLVFSLYEVSAILNISFSLDCMKI